MPSPFTSRYSYVLSCICCVSITFLLSSFFLLSWHSDSILIDASTPDASTEIDKRPRGVAISKASLYVPKNGKFTCLDKSKSISFKAVNDDYCDCPDGSDEPGTAACPNFKFHCTNSWHKPAYIPSSRVNDGICDPECCDGTDEYDGKVKCQNVCKELAAAEKAKKEALIKMRKDGERLRKEYIEYGQKSKNERKLQLVKLEQDLENAKKEVERLKKLRDVAEEAERQAQQDLDKQQMTEQCTPQTLTDLRQKITNLQRHVDTLIGIIDKLRPLSTQEDAAKDDLSTAVKTAIDELDTWDAVSPDSDFEEVKEPEKKENLFAQVVEEEESLLDKVKSYIYPIVGWEVELSPLKKARQEATTARNNLYDGESKQRNLENDLNNLKKKETYDYGDDLEFAKLDDQCYSVNKNEYTYEICPYGSASQKSISGGYSNHLGTWDSTSLVKSPTTNRVVEFQFLNGWSCGGDVNRKARVFLECSDHEELMSAEEPEKCEYHFRFKTVTVCYPGEGKEEKSETGADKKEKENVRDEL
ncbi:glucosidase II beta subunit-like-domain-containing protein [Paraphysoderma sedebokerense]|nr:glucosidase II beta subunit-like-domain-containing protein [Paraphysoderma sedebokerense]